METPRAPNEDLSGTGDKDQATDQCEEFPARPGGAAASAFIQPPWHYGRRRLCVAEGQKLAGSAARSLSPERRYPRISRGGKRLYRKPARPHRRFAKDPDQGNARADQGGRF